MSRFLLLASMLLAVACHTPPEEACNRVRFGWPFLELDPTSDVNDGQDGIQVDFDVRSDLAGGIRANLFQRIDVGEDETEQVYLGEATSDSDGLLSFRNITVPEGDLVLIIEARSNCGLHRTGRRLFVWDGLGIPQCEMSLATPPAMPTDGSIPVLSSEQDEDALAEGMQVRFLVQAGRPDMEVTLFTRDRERDESDEISAFSDSSGLSEFAITLPTGEQAVRAVCYWEPEDVRVNTATRLFYVEEDEP